METKKIIVSEKTFEEMELPETVYKYRVWDNPFHKTIITKQEVFFAAPMGHRTKRINPDEPKYTVRIG